MQEGRRFLTLGAAQAAPRTATSGYSRARRGPRTRPRCISPISEAGAVVRRRSGVPGAAGAGRRPSARCRAAPDTAGCAESQIPKGATDGGHCETAV
jgi:hypothetical protein